jgi:MFS family permease
MKFCGSKLTLSKVGSLARRPRGADSPHTDSQVSVQGAQWIVNGYMLMLGALILVGGSAGDRFGRRRVFALGAAIFTAASIGCGLASNATVLIAARVVQGIGGALLVPGSLALISAAFPAEERGKAIGTWAGFSAVTAALGIGQSLEALTRAAERGISLPRRNVLAECSTEYAMRRFLALLFAVLALSVASPAVACSPGTHPCGPGCCEGE